MWTVFHLVSLYPVSAGPRLILFSWTTSKPLIRYPLQAYSSCLFAFGYLLAKVARKGVIGERLIRCFRSALTFPPPSPPATGCCSPAGKCPGWQGPSYRSWPPSISSGGDQGEGGGEVGGQKQQVKPCKPLSPTPAAPAAPIPGEDMQQCVHPAKCCMPIYMHLCIERLKNVTVLQLNSATVGHPYRG